MTTEDWRQLQEDLTAGDCWILDGDLGPYDALDVRLRRAEAVVLFDVPTMVRVLRAVRRSRERRAFWWWLLTWQWRQMPHLLRAIQMVAPGAARGIRFFLFRGCCAAVLTVHEIRGRVALSQTRWERRYGGSSRLPDRIEGQIEGHTGVNNADPSPRLTAATF